MIFKVNKIKKTLLLFGLFFVPIICFAQNSSSTIRMVSENDLHYNKLAELNIFLNGIPSSIYLLLGIFLSGAVSLYTVRMNNENNIKLKTIEKSNLKEKEFFEKELFMFIEFIERKARFFDNQKNIKENIFEIYNNLFNSISKLSLLIPEKHEDLKELKKIVRDLSNEFILHVKVGVPNSDILEKRIQATRKKLSEKSDAIINYMSEVIK